MFCLIFTARKRKVTCNPNTLSPRFSVFSYLFRSVYGNCFVFYVIFYSSLPVRVLKHLSCVWLILLSVLSPQLCSVISTPTSSFHYMQSVSFIIFLSGVIPPLFCLFTFYGRFPVFRPPHVASRVQCVWAPVSGSPVLWAKWSRLLWETLWHGEGIKDWPPTLDCCPVSHSSLPGLHTRVTLI